MVKFAKCSESHICDLVQIPVKFVESHICELVFIELVCRHSSLVNVFIELGFDIHQLRNENSCEC